MTNRVLLPTIVGKGAGSYLIATDKQGNALYEYRNYRMGGRSYAMRERTTGQIHSWGNGENGYRKPPAGGRWKRTHDVDYERKAHVRNCGNKVEVTL